MSEITRRGALQLAAAGAVALSGAARAGAQPAGLGDLKVVLRVEPGVIVKGTVKRKQVALRGSTDKLYHLDKGELPESMKPAMMGKEVVIKEPFHNSTIRFVKHDAKLVAFTVRKDTSLAVDIYYEDPERNALRCCVSCGNVIACGSPSICLQCGPFEVCCQDM